jgi:acetoin utilization protein AcuB
MFHIISVDGFNRALVPGEFRRRDRVEPVEIVPPIERISGGLPPTPDGHGRQGALVAHYKAHQTDHEDPSEVLFVREIMTKGVVTASPTTSIGEISHLFSDHRYRHIPIVSGKAELIGLVSDRDILRYQAKSSSRERDKEPVSSIMVSEVLVGTADTLIRDVARTMIEERIGSLPIVGERNAVVGIVTRSDIVRALIVHGPMRLWA